MRNLLTILALTTVVSAVAQQLPPKAIGLPEELASYHVHNDIANVKLKDRKQFWYVHADRAGVPLYDGPTGYNKVANVNLDLGQPVTVAEVSKRDGRALVFNMVKESAGWPHISPEAEVLGWVELDQCFISSYCLKGEGLLSGKKGKSFSLPRKAILSPRTNISLGEREELSFYSAPSTNSQNFNSQRFLFEPYYIMKEENGWLLLSKTDKMSSDPISAEGQMVGWIQASKVVEWGTRTTLEPNWTSAANRIYASGIPAFDFNTNGQNDAAAYQANQDNTATPVAKFNCTGNRLLGETMRPISLANSNGVVETLLTLNPGSNMNETLNSEIAKIKERQNNINIVFVIDGTKSMDPYYEPCVKAIEEASRSIRARQSSANIKYAAVIYRDLGHREDALAILPLNRSIDAVKNFLRGVECTSIGDRDIPESMFYGLFDGVKQLDVPNNESNLLIHVGDAGNPIENDPNKLPAGGMYRTSEDVARLIHELDFNLVSFQVNRSAHPSYFHFGQQMKSVMSEAMRRNRVASGANWEGKARVNSGYELVASNASDEAPIIPVFELTLAEEGQTSTDILQNSIEAAIVDMDKQAQKRINWLESQIVSSSTSKEFREWLRIQLRKEGLSETEIEARIDALSQSQGDIIRKAYTTQEVTWSEEVPPFKSVIYLSEREFRELMNKMKGLNDLESKSASSQRNGFIDVLTTQILASAGISSGSLNVEQKEEYKKILESKTMAEIWESLFGYIPRDYGEDVINLPLGNFAKAQEKTSDKGLSKEDWNTFFLAFVNKYKNIQRYQSQRYPFFKLIGADNRYYWIDAEEMP